MLLLVLLFVAALSLYALRFYLESKSFPPGFPRYPVVGSLLSTGGKRASMLLIHTTNMASQYGKLIGYFAGPSLRAVFIQDYDLAKEVVTSDVFGGRLETSFTRDVRGYGHRNVGIITTEGHVWKTNRKFVATILKDFLHNESLLSMAMESEFAEAAADLRARTGNDVLFDQNFNVAVLNVLWTIVAGKRFKPSDPEIVTLLRMQTDAIKHTFTDAVAPWLPYVAPEASGFNNKRRHMNIIKSMFEKIIAERKKELNKDSVPKDLIEVYLVGMQTNPDLTEEDLVGVCIDLFQAGTENTTNTMSFIVLYLALFPQVQDKCRKELEDVIGCGRVTLSARGRLPFLEATVMEVQRIASVAPGGLERKALQNTRLGGYDIPKGTLFAFNTWKWHHDPAYFPSPWSFRPERFLSGDGSGVSGVSEGSGVSGVVRPAHFLPFGFGQRVCMGADLAKAELFLFTAIVVQSVVVATPTSHPPPAAADFDGGVSIAPRPYYVHVTAR